jgi:hypothetical protein
MKFLNPSKCLLVWIKEFDIGLSFKSQRLNPGLYPSISVALISTIKYNCDKITYDENILGY